MDLSLLQEWGLTINEAKAYLTLLEIGQSLAGTIAEKAKIHRRNVYDALKRLIEKGFVTCIIKTNKKYYEAASPEKIISILEEKINMVNISLPELLKKYKNSKSKQEVSFFQGKGGMKTFFGDIYKERKDLFVIGATGKAYSKLKFFILSWIKKISKLKITIKILWNFNAENKKEFSEMITKDKILPENFATPTQIFIYGEKSAIVIWLEEPEEPLCILINNREIADGFKKYFDLMWKFSK